MSDPLRPNGEIGQLQEAVEGLKESRDGLWKAHGDMRKSLEERDRAIWRTIDKFVKQPACEKTMEDLGGRVSKLEETKNKLIGAVIAMNALIVILQLYQILKSTFGVAR